MATPTDVADWLSAPEVEECLTELDARKNDELVTEAAGLIRLMRSEHRRLWNERSQKAGKVLELEAERIGLRVAVSSLMAELVWVNEQLDLMPDSYAEAQAKVREAMGS